MDAFACWEGKVCTEIHFVTLQIDTMLERESQKTECVFSRALNKFKY